MTDFKVTIWEKNGDLSIFTEPTSLKITNEQIEVEYDGQRSEQRLDSAKEITITINS